MPRRTDIKKVLVIGSGPIVIGQAAEFDYAGTQACLALKEDGIEVILVNNNPATIMTDDQVADKVYIEPLTVETLTAVIEKEKPDGLIGTLGGQTGLNLTVELYDKGILTQNNVQLLGTSAEAIKKGEDRDAFRRLLMSLGEPITPSKIIHSYDEGLEFAKTIGFPVIIRPAYTLGGYGGGFAKDEDELYAVINKGLEASPIHQVLIEKSIKGWKEIEYEVMRDANDTCVIVCNMENIDPVGVHTGDSMVVAPSQTLSDRQYQLLRSASLRVIRALGVVGGCNIQFALDPNSDDYVIIEVNPRVSRSSALASKATGYPIARIAAKCALGYHLDEIINPITGTTFAAFEPAIDYVVVKLPRFPFDKFPEADRRLGTQMKATGEVMAIDRTFEGALNKAVRSLELKTHGLYGFGLQDMTNDALTEHLENASDLRLFALAEWFRRGFSVAQAYKITGITPWFLEKIKGLLDFEKSLSDFTWDTLPTKMLLAAKRLNISDQWLAAIFDVDEKTVRQKRYDLNLKPSYKLVDTCAAEFRAETPYYYSTWAGSCEVEVTHRPKILVIGSGPIRIGQGIEFDYCSVRAALAAKHKGYETIVMNNNPETVSTDFSIADKLYFEPLTTEDILHVIEKENVSGVILQFGGQTAINLAKDLEEAGVHVFGTGVDAIDQTEDRKRFYELLETLNIPHIQGATAHHFTELRQAVKNLGFPVLIRPSYVIGGRSMVILHDEHELARYIHDNSEEVEWPLLIDRYLQGIECEADVLSDGVDVFIPGLFEHIERAGVHSGDSISIFPAATIPDPLKRIIVDYTERIARALEIKGLMNIQFVIHNGTVYVLEVNPRASRTVPIASKITGIPLVDLAVKVQLGERLREQKLPKGLLHEMPYFSVKVPVFSANKLTGTDPALGPEMKSTGEKLGLGFSVKDAFQKALGISDGFSPYFKPRDSTVVCSIANRDKPKALPLIRAIHESGYAISATAGTARYLRRFGIPAQELTSFDDVRERVFSGTCCAILNIPTEGKRPHTFGFQLRALATEHHIPLFTCIETMELIWKYKPDKENHEPFVLPLASYRMRTFQNA